MVRNLVLALLLPACSVVSGVKAERELTLTADHVPGSELVVRSSNGTLQIQGDPQADRVRIEATLVCVGATQAEADTRVAHAKVHAERTGDTLTIAPEFPDERRSGDGASFKVRLPDASRIVAETSNGSVKVILLGGDLRIRTSNGGVGVIDHKGPVEIETSNGGVLMRNISGRVRARTSNGEMVAENVGAPTDLKSSNGGIQLVLAADQAGPIHARTSNGAIGVTIGGAFRGPVWLKTSNGRLVVQDRFGRVTSKKLDKGKRSGTVHVGKGGEKSTIQTSNGNVTFTIGK
ncbi:MAG: DUF4097 family beta strand repeat-containing protein [Planctomycetota bacterium]|jgi:hypothetical protein